MTHYTKTELYRILDWHTERGYSIACTWQYCDQGGQEGVLLEWRNTTRQLEYWLTVEES